MNNKHYFVITSVTVDFVETHGKAYTVHFSTPWMSGKVSSMIKTRMPKQGQKGKMVVYKDTTGRQFFSSMKAA